MTPLDRIKADRLVDYRKRIERAREILEHGPFQLGEAEGDEEAFNELLRLLTLQSDAEKAEAREVQPELRLSMLVGVRCYACQHVRTLGWIRTRELDSLRRSEACPECGHGGGQEIELCGERCAFGLCHAPRPCGVHDESEKFT
ncbi:MAG TPA: hypothetical protein VMB05_18415 [Solirubrobacteraceae bacterium]|nr:hypothetical protein [Solirubrobacteraceae bacterium]